jgi:hypothetical protein
MEHRGDDGAVPSPNDQRMWRLLLARLHPDAGGDHELFVFASTVKDEVCGKDSLKSRPVHHSRRRAGHPAVAYLRLWQTLMTPWTCATPRRDSDR